MTEYTRPNKIDRSSGLRVHSATIRVCVGVIDKSIFSLLSGFTYYCWCFSPVSSFAFGAFCITFSSAQLYSQLAPTGYNIRVLVHKFSPRRRTWLVHDSIPLHSRTPNPISTRSSNDNSSPASWLHNERAARLWQVPVEARGNVRAARPRLLHAPPLPRVATPFVRFSNSHVADIVQIRFRLLLANWAQLSARAAASGGRNLHWHDILLLINLCRLRL